MLHSKIIECPETPVEIEEAAAPLAAMAMDYAIELGIGKTIYNSHDFILGWMKGTKFAIGVYSEDELVGMILGDIRYHAFTDAKTLVVTTVYLRREYRKQGDGHIVEAFTAGKAYAKKIGAVSIILHADPGMIKSLEKYGGTLGYVSVHFDVEG